MIPGGGSSQRLSLSGHVRILESFVCASMTFSVARETRVRKHLAFALRPNLIPLAYYSAHPLSCDSIGRMQTNALFALAVATVAGQ